MPDFYNYSFGSLSTDMADLPSMMSYGHNVIMAIALKYFFDSTYSPIYIVYFGDAMSIIMALMGAAFVLCHTVNSAVHFDIGYYFTFADRDYRDFRLFGSDTGD